MREIGDHIPSVSLRDDKGELVDLASLKGQPFVLFFYPKDDTPTCTKEVCFFRDALSEFEKLSCPVFGVSRDDKASHEAFRDKFDLNFPLLTDADGGLCEAMGVWKERSRDGKTFMGIERSTFLMDKDGVIRAAWRDVDVNGHVDEILAELGKL